MGMKLKNIQRADDDTVKYGVCVWKMNNNEIIGDGDGNYLSLGGPLYHPVIEQKMYKAVKSYIGDEVDLGKPFWYPGARQVSDEEYIEQLQRLEAGLIPDPVEAIERALT